MSSRNFSAQKQMVRPPQRGIFPLDHDAECQQPMQEYLACLQLNQEVHHKCRDLSKHYLQCRMDRNLMVQDDLNKLGYSEAAKVENAVEYDRAKEKAGFIAGKSITKPSPWFWQRTSNSWSWK